jgi:hypothetical protein
MMRCFEPRYDPVAPTGTAPSVAESAGDCSRRLATRNGTEMSWINAATTNDVA